MQASTEQTYVFYTRHDTALGRWYWLFEWETPVGYAGVRAAKRRWGSDVKAIDCTGSVEGHNAYHASSFVLNVLNTVVNATADESPPEDTASQNTALEDTAPKGTALEDTVPQDTVPQDATPKSPPPPRRSGPDRDRQPNPV
jgi:hypothetical protein